MKTLILVTQQHIKRGSISADSCPIALAIQCVVNSGLMVSVLPCFDSLGDVSIHGRLIGLTYRANSFANRFDKAVTARKGRAALKPFSFYLDIPRELLRSARP